MYRVTPTVVGVDRHPGYLTRRWALRRSLLRSDGVGAGARPDDRSWFGEWLDRPRLVDVQHHHAHVAAAMAEHGLGLDTEVLGIAFDGTGYRQRSRRIVPDLGW